LGETARRIADNTEEVANAASSSLHGAEQVREVSEHAVLTSQRGQHAVNDSIGAVEEVRLGITNMAERLMDLTARSRKISSIIGLIKEISDETHLLALNAAIESSGAGEQGLRFGVIASEVKNLSDRTLEATREVTQVINDLQGAIAGTVLASEETRKKTFGAVERSYQAGEIITELGQVVDETARSGRNIVTTIQKVAQLSQEIKLATQQQESASQQLITTMETVGIVAQQTASAINQVSLAVNEIDRLSNQLEGVLRLNQTPMAAFIG
jgi:methyl-accepting chemotaxis protein